MNWLSYLKKIRRRETSPQIISKRNMFQPAVLIRVGLMVSLGCLSLAGQSQERVGQPPQQHEVEVRLILVDVIATKGGEFYPGLKKGDFRLFEDGKEVEINSCDLISLGKSDLQLSLEKRAGVPIVFQKKRLAVLFDGINAWDRELKKVAQQISDEIGPLVKSGMDVMVFQLDNEKGLKIVQPFTDQEALIRAATGKAKGAAFNPDLELLDLDPLEHLNVAQTRLTRTFSGLLACLYMLENLPGRKNLLFVSPGFPDLDTFKIDNGLALLGNIRVFDPFGILGKKTFGTGDDVLKEVIRIANDRNISIYSLDSGIFVKNMAYMTMAGSLAQVSSKSALSTERYRQIQNLRTIAEKTGANLLRGADKIESLREVVRQDLSFYYQLSYYPQKKGTLDYYNIEVKVRDRNDIKIRYREGYSDTPVDIAKRLIVAKAFYNPGQFSNTLPFEAEFIPLIQNSGRSQPWMHVALPKDGFFDGRFAGVGQKSYEFHFWIKGEQETERALMGEISLPLDIETIRNRLGSGDFFRLHFSGPILDLPDRGYRVTYALFDPESGEIGTWVYNVQAPALKYAKSATIINCTLADAISGVIDNKGTFSLNNRDGGLEFGQMKLFPKIAGSFSRMENALVFCQIYYPQGPSFEIGFNLLDKNGLAHPIEGKKTMEFWDKTSKIWSGTFKLDFKNMEAGDYYLKIEIPLSGIEPKFIKEMKLTIS